MKKSSGGAVTHGQVKMVRLTAMPLGVTLNLGSPEATKADEAAAAKIVDSDFGADWLSASWHKSSVKDAATAEKTVEAHRAKIVAAIAKRGAIARELTEMGLTSGQVAKAISYGRSVKNRRNTRPEVKAAGFLARLEPLKGGYEAGKVQVLLPGPTGGAGGMNGLFSGPAPETAARLTGPTMAAPAARSAAERAADVKGLLDAGIIDQEAFDAKVVEILRSI